MKSGGSVKLYEMGGFAKVSGSLNSMKTYGLSTLAEIMPTRKCSYGVSPTKVSKVGELTNVLDHLLKRTKVKVLQLEAKKTLVEISQKLTNPFMTTCDLQSFATRFGNIATT
jgi:hypothetical protein